jgi:hypothetical protein
MPSNKTVFNFFLTPHVLIDVHQAFCTHPQKRGKILIFVRSVKVYKTYCSETVALMVSHTINNILPLCLVFVDST